MYNRYIPQPDGSYKKNRMPEPRRPHAQQCPQDKQPPHENCPEPEHNAPAPCIPVSQEHAHRPTGRKPPSATDSIPGFFRQLLPKDMDTADLLIIILLLLMAGDCEEDRNNALLTLALYFFM